MKRRAAPGVFAGLCLFLTVSAAFAAPVAQQPAPRLTKPMQRCAALEAQAAGLYKIHADLGGAKAEAEIGLGRSLCASGKPAEGLRHYVKGLRIMGVQPELPKP